MSSTYDYGSFYSNSYAPSSQPTSSSSSKGNTMGGGLSSAVGGGSKSSSSSGGSKSSSSSGGSKSSSSSSSGSKSSSTSGGSYSSSSSGGGYYSSSSSSSGGGYYSSSSSGGGVGFASQAAAAYSSPAYTGGGWTSSGGSSTGYSSSDSGSRSTLTTVAGGTTPTAFGGGGTSSSGGGVRVSGSQYGTTAPALTPVNGIVTVPGSPYTGGGVTGAGVAAGIGGRTAGAAMSAPMPNPSPRRGPSGDPTTRGAPNYAPAAGATQAGLQGGVTAAAGPVTLEAPGAVWSDNIAQGSGVGAVPATAAPYQMKSVAGSPLSSSLQIGVQGQLPYQEGPVTNVQTRVGNPTPSTPPPGQSATKGPQAVYGNFYNNSGAPAASYWQPATGPNSAVAQSAFSPAMSLPEIVVDGGVPSTQGGYHVPGGQANLSVDGATQTMTTRQAQLGFVVQELNSTEARAGRDIRAAQTVEEATQAAIGYLRPAGYTRSNPTAGHGYDNRLANAERIYAGRGTAEEREAFDYFVGQGFSREQAAGIVGNLSQESYTDLRTDAIGDQGTAAGIAQWRGDRRTAMEQYVQGAGATATSGPTTVPNPRARPDTPTATANAAAAAARDFTQVGGNRVPGTEPQGGVVYMANQGATRNQNITPDLRSALEQAGRAAGVNVRVTSGGQDAKGKGSRRVEGSSTRHDRGNAADLQLMIGDRVLDFTNPNDRPYFERFAAEGAKLGMNGMGAGVEYMGPNTVHVGFGQDHSKGGRVTTWGSAGQGWLGQSVSGITGPTAVPSAPMPSPRASPRRDGTAASSATATVAPTGTSIQSIMPMSDEQFRSAERQRAQDYWFN